MRSRILLPLLVLVVASATLLLASTLDSLSRDRSAQLGLERRLAIDRIATLARLAVEENDPTALQRHVHRYHDLFGEGVLVVDATGQILVGTAGFDVGEVERRIRDFGHNLPDLELPLVVPWSPATATISAPVEVDRGVSSGAVVMEVDLTSARADVQRSWLLMAAPTLLLLIMLTLLAAWGARWILRPVHELDQATNALAAGDAVPDVLIAGPPELQRLARSFRTMADTLFATLTQQRDLVANTSHQLRNPLAAVRLHVDLLAHDPGRSAPTIAAVQRDLDRLDNTIDRLLGIAEAEHRVAEARATRLVTRPVPSSELTSAPAVAGDLRLRWASRPGQRIDVVGEPGLELAVTKAEVVEMVETVLENAVKYAGPDATVRVVLCSAGHGRAMIRIDDDGRGLSDEELAHVGVRFWRSSRHADQPGTGLGLALVDALARAAGGSMSVGRSARGGLEVLLDLPAGSPC